MAIVLGVLSAEVKAMDNTGSYITIDGSTAKYADNLISITVVGMSESVTSVGTTLVYLRPQGDRVSVDCSCAAGYVAYVKDIDSRMDGGHVTYGVRNASIEEDTHEVTLAFERAIEIDLDCDSDWDGDIDEEDDGNEDIFGALVGRGKSAPLEFRMDDVGSDAEDAEVSFYVSGGIALYAGGDQEWDGELLASGIGDGPDSVTFPVGKIPNPLCVKGLVRSEHFGDCAVKAVYTDSRQRMMQDADIFTVVDVDVSIAGQDEDAEEAAGAFALYVNDFKGSPYAPRATNYFVDVQLKIVPDDFPEGLQTNIWIEIGGDAETHLFEHVPTAATWGVAPYSLAAKSYTLAELNKQKLVREGEPSMFAIHGHMKSESLRGHNITIKEPKTKVEDKGLFTVVKLGVIPDYDRDHEIGDKDEEQLCLDKKFYWWKNNDHDKGDSADIYKDYGTEIHKDEEVKVRVGSIKANMLDDTVNGRTDLLDFFPMWIDVYEALNLFGGGDDLGVRLVFPGLGIVDTDLSKGMAGKFLCEEHLSIEQKTPLHEAEVDKSGSTTFIKDVSLFGLRLWEKKAFLEQMRKNSDKGVLMVEGRDSGGDVVIVFTRKNATTGAVDDIISATTRISIKDVRAFYNELSLYDGEASISRERDPELDELFSTDKDVFSLHGFKVDITHADGWHSEFFKRLYQSQSSARFWGVSWNGIQSENGMNPGRFFHKDAAHAFVAGKLFKDFVNNGRVYGPLNGEVSVMAHSLGNMVVSSAIVLEGMRIDRYLMLDAAVAAEAYVGEKDDTRMINSQWRGYASGTFCSKWFRLFDGVPRDGEDGIGENDARKNLKWPNLFAIIDCMVFNYYSTGDEVFELKQDIAMKDGFKLKHGGDLSQYCWQKQEIGKGADMEWNLLVDNNPEEGITGRSGGWGFHDPKHSNVTANAESATNLRRNPVFAHTPEWVYEWSKYDNELTKKRKPALLCHVVPAMSQAAGRVALEWDDRVASKGYKNENFNTSKYKNGWGRNDADYQQRWLHCDLKDMAYYYNYKAWDKIVLDGNFIDEGTK